MAHEELDKLRAEIDGLDEKLVFLLVVRFQITDRIGLLKHAVGLPPIDAQREVEQMVRVGELAQQAGLNTAFAHKFLRLVIDEVVRHHQRF